MKEKNIVNMEDALFEALMSGTTPEKIIKQLANAKRKVDQEQKEKENEERLKRIAEARDVLIRATIDYGVAIGGIDPHKFTSKEIDTIRSEIEKFEKELGIEDTAQGMRRFHPTTLDMSEADKVFERFLSDIL